MAAEPAPLVSIGIPTYNRASRLKRAVESALAQSHANLEIVISDNASTDDTAQLCEAVRERDRRVRYVRHAENRGAPFNFQSALRHARGEFFMWLADDDWLDPDYIAECLAVLLRHPEFTLVSGLAQYFRDGEDGYRATPLQLTSDDPVERVGQYYLRVRENGIFYGVMRRAAISQVPFRDVLASDWLIVASLAFLGKATTIEPVAVHREMAGASWEGIDRLATDAGLRGVELWNPYIHIARRAATDILRHSPVYRRLGRRQRLRLALQVYRTILVRYGVPLARTRLDGRPDLPSRVANRLLRTFFP